MDSLDNVDIDRMRRVLDRVLPGDRPPPPSPGPRPPRPVPPPPPPPETELLSREWRAQALLGALRRCRSCARSLQGMAERGRRRIRRLETELYLSTGRTPPPPPDVRTPDGVLGTARQLYRTLTELSEAYAAAPGGEYELFARQCRADADRVRSLLERAR